MKVKLIIFAIMLNYLNLVFGQVEIVNEQDGYEYKISSEKYITDSNGNIRMNVNIWGHVAQPGNHLVFEGIDMVTLLSMVGGARTGAKLDRIKLIREVPDKDGKLVYTINFNKFLNSGDRSNFIKIKPNDTIIIPQKLSSVILASASGFNTILGLVNLYFQISNLLQN